MNVNEIKEFTSCMSTIDSTILIYEVMIEAMESECKNSHEHNKQMKQELVDAKERCRLAIQRMFELYAMNGKR